MKRNGGMYPLCSYFIAYFSREGSFRWVGLFLCWLGKSIEFLFLDSSFGGDRYISLEPIFCAKMLSSQHAFFDGQSELAKQLGLLLLPLVGVEE